MLFFCLFLKRGSFCVALAILEFSDSPASATPVLGSKVCAAATTRLVSLFALSLHSTEQIQYSFWVFKEDYCFLLTKTWYFMFQSCKQLQLFKNEKFFWTFEWGHFYHPECGLPKPSQKTSADWAWKWHLGKAVFCFLFWHYLLSISVVN